MELTEEQQRAWNRIKTKIDFSGDCWIWTAGKGRRDYGSVWYRGRNLPAHRVVYELLVGPIPEGLMLLHSCDNPPCVRPDHLRPGTCKDNAQDMLSRGREASGDRHYSITQPEKVLRGEGNGLAKLTEQDVIEIRGRHAAGESLYRLAADYNVSRPNIGYIVRGVTWTHCIDGKTPIVKERPSNRKLQPAQIKEIRARYANKTSSAKELAAEFGVSRLTISWILNGRHYKEIQ